MRPLLFAAVASLSLGACAIETGEPAVSDTQSALSALVFYEKFDNLVNGPIGGQNGWSGNCSVVGAPDKRLACQGDGAQQDAQRSTNTGLETWGDYYMQFDVSMVGVVDGTHGKLFVEGPVSGEDTVFQIVTGCGGIRGVFGYYGATTRQLISFPCASRSTPYRVICLWQSWGSAISCGAARLPSDPQWPDDFVDIPAQDNNGEPEEIPAFDRVRVLGGIGGRPGTTSFDKIYLERL